MTLEAQRTTTDGPLDAARLHALEDAVAFGDREAYASLHDLLLPHVYATIASAVDAARAASLTAAVLVDAWRAAPRLRAAGTSVSAWTLDQARRVARATQAPTAA